MNKLPIDKPTALERVTDHLGTNLAATLLAAFSGTAVAALLPVLVSSLASGRHQLRLEGAIENMATTLASHESKLRNLTDAQYKLVNEAILAAFSTVDDEKLEYLQQVVANALHISDIKQQEAVLLSRLVRDLSADEARFVLAHEKLCRIWFNETDPAEKGEKGPLHVNPNSVEGLVVSGLVSLGLLMPAEPTFDQSGMLRYAPIVPKLIQLLRKGT